MDQFLSLKSISGLLVLLVSDAHSISHVVNHSTFFKNINTVCLICIFDHCLCALSVSLYFSFDVCLSCLKVIPILSEVMSANSHIIRSKWEGNQRGFFFLLHARGGGGAGGNQAEYFNNSFFYFMSFIF